MARKRKKIPQDESVAAAVNWWKWVGDVESQQRIEEQECLGFQIADGAWAPDVKSAREALGPGMPGYTGVPIPARPMISIPLLDEPFALAAAQVRAAHLAPTIRALSEDATDETAKVLQDLYRSIERDSRASNVRNWSYDRAWWAGRGAYRIDKEYDPYGGHPFDQKIVIKRILDQSWVRLDPHAQEPDWSDGKRAMIGVPMSWATYKQKYPKSKVASFDDRTLSTLTTQDGLNQWVQGTNDEERTVIVAEDWRVECTYDKWVLLDNGDASAENDIPEGRTAITGDAAQWKYVEKREVYWRTINCCEVLEPEQKWDGQYIPLVPVIWRELQPNNGKREWIGVVSNAKGPVRLTNFGASGVVEMAVTEPKAPYHLDPRQIEGFEDYWKQLATRNWPYLPSHKEKDGQAFDRPDRVQLDVSRLGPSMSLMTMGRDFVQTATSTFDPALGKQPTAHRSGVAIRALQGQTEESTSGGLDNLAQISMTYEAIVILDLIPKVYDRPGRIARVTDDQGDSQLIMFNAPFAPHPQTKRPVPLPHTVDENNQVQLPPDVHAAVDDPAHPARYYNLDKGRYAVEVTVGKSYKSQRQESENEMGALLQADPALMPLIGPEYFKSKAQPWAMQIAEILGKMRDHQMPFLKSDDPKAQIPPQLQQHVQEMEQQLQKLGMEKQAKVIEQQGSIEETKLKAQVEIHKTQLSLDAQADRELALQVMKNAAAIAVAHIGAASKGASLTAHAQEEAQALGHEATQNAMDRRHDILQGQLAQGNSLMQGDQDHQQALQQSDQDHQQTMEQADQGHQQALEQGQQAGDQQAALAQQSQEADAAQAEQAPPDEGAGA